jgi:hypothetical protein
MLFLMKYLKPNLYNLNYSKTTVKIEAKHSFETSVSIYHTTRRHKPPQETVFFAVSAVGTSNLIYHAEATSREASSVVPRSVRNPKFVYGF